jgi:hypothetical protein
MWVNSAACNAAWLVLDAAHRAKLVNTSSTPQFPAIATREAVRLRSRSPPTGPLAARACTLSASLLLDLLTRLRRYARAQSHRGAMVTTAGVFLTPRGRFSSFRI